MHRAAGGAAEGGPGPVGGDPGVVAQAGERPGRAKSRLRVHETIVSEFI